jgi:Zn-dependent protease with chaperone function
MIRFVSQLDRPPDRTTAAADWLIPLEAERFRRRFDQLGQAIPAAAFSLAGQALPDELGPTDRQRARHERRKSLRARLRAAGEADEPTSVFRHLEADLRRDTFAWPIGVLFGLFGLFLVCCVLAMSALTGFEGYWALVRPDEPALSTSDPDLGFEGSTVLAVATAILTGLLVLSAVCVTTTHRLLPRLVGGKPLDLDRPTGQVEQRLAAAITWASETAGCRPRVWIVDDPAADAAPVGHGPAERPNVLVTTGAAKLSDSGLAALVATAIGYSVVGFRLPTLLSTALLPLAAWYRSWRLLLGLWFVALIIPAGLGTLQGRSDVDRLSEGVIPGLLWAGFAFGLLALVYAMVEPVPRLLLRHADLGAIIAMGGLTPWIRGRQELVRPADEGPKARLPVWVLPRDDREHANRIEALTGYLPEEHEGAEALARLRQGPEQAGVAKRRNPSRRRRKTVDAPPPQHRSEPDVESDN